MKIQVESRLNIRFLTLLAPLVLFAGWTQAGEVPQLVAERIELTADERALAEWVAAREAAILKELRELVEINSGTLNREGIDRIRDLLRAELESLGFATRTVPGGTVEILTCEGGEVRFADHLVATRHQGDGPRILLNGHMDTVFPEGSDFDRLEVDGDVLKGPGVSDMKGGIVAMLYALRALDAVGLLDEAHLTVLLNSDEEMGSLGSRSLIESLASEHDLGMVFEGTSGNDLTRYRKGLGQVRLRTRGRAAHAGNAHQEGVSAVHEMAHKVVAIEQLTDYGNQTTVNVGMVSGGEARNTVPPCAEAFIDLRYPENDLGKGMIAAIGDIVATPHTRNDFLGMSPQTEIWAVLHRPAKPIHPDSDAIMTLAMGISAALGQPLGTRYSGGGTDGSIMQAAGLPNADSLGPDGSGDHSRREQSSLSSLIQRSGMIAIMLRRLIEGDESGGKSIR